MVGTRGMGAAASTVVHGLALLTLLVSMQISRDAPADDAIPALIPQHLIWIPHDAGGAGSNAGGQRAVAPPRRLRAVGADSTSAPTKPSPSMDATVEAPPEIAVLPVKPAGDAMQPLPGAIESSGVSLGPADSGAGNSMSPGQGIGNKAGNSFGDAVGVGGPGVTAPTLLERVAPKYTVEAMQARIQGTAVVECIVNIDGTVSDARIFRSLDRRFGLDEEALKAARRWRFRPGLLRGKPVPVAITIELMFTVR